MGGPELCPGDWDLAAGELENLLEAHGTEASPVCRAAVVKWHLERMALVRNETWIPGLGPTGDAVVEKMLSRFHSQRIRSTIAQLAVQNSELASCLGRAVDCLKFYALRRADGAYARSVIASLTAAPRRLEPPEPAPERFFGGNLQT